MAERGRWVGDGEKKRRTVAMVVVMWIIWGTDVIHLVDAPAMKTGVLAKNHFM